MRGGAGNIMKRDLTTETQEACLKVLSLALDTGYAILKNGGTSLDAVREAVAVLEDNPHFNAGRGSVFTKKGLHEMDAAIMDGSDLAAGAVAGVRNVRNPIELALAIMRNSYPVFLRGSGANDFALKQGIRLEPADNFFSRFRYEQCKQMRHGANFALNHSTQQLEK